LENYACQLKTAPDAPLIFLGRLEKIKGAHAAIKIAKETGHKLILAGNKPTLAHELHYFNNEVEPFIDGQQIIYVGPVNDEQKNRYLGQAKALLFPIEWEEPFGIVMAESLACGTPVIAMNRGSVREVVRDGITGFVCADINEMVSSIGKIGTIDRKNCRLDCEKRFSSCAIAESYLSIYKN
jgi:glycosyltransferase involved in cell wall biosynthesis